ncbi:hypothetical protein SXCG_00002 [Synechococcus phage S-CAM8]|uniref:Gp6 n=1 Tax=Synechococcus phage S-CAM8 TaxID=754038 RepID=G8EXQ1_9CAUD|nr:baseplate wedge subunit [Synechococcus phage S-CAM8]AET72591.1 gp6 [Synechococcus phage S-CAM8]AGN33922.1 hypothetical protein SXCG_00002 [Synechococcus phage S-CAM8]
MQPNKITALDFEDIKSSIKSYLRTRKEFTDYDFEGSALSYLIDVLAYNTYYTSFNANMAMNETFIPSATVRDNIVNIAKLLNYTPRSVTASVAHLDLTVQTQTVNGSYPSTITLNKGAAATGGNYIWNRLNSATLPVDAITGRVTFPHLCLYEGALINFSYVVSTFARQEYIIPSADADVSTLKVTVKANESSTTSDSYSRVLNVTNLTATDRVYFLSEGEDMRYTVTFGDDSLGRSMKDGEVINFEYLTTSGGEANGVNDLSFIGTLIDSNGITYGQANTTVTILKSSDTGDSAETIESIKYNAPRYYASQYRAVTAQDYATITKNIYSNASSVVAYGGDTLNPPVYGKVYIVIKTKTGTILNDVTKKQISNDLRQYAMASIDPIVIDPDEMYIYTKVFTIYDTGSGKNASDVKTTIQNAISDWASQTQINNFNSTFRSNDFQRAIGLADSSLIDVSIQTTILKYINADTNQTNTYCISTGGPLYNSAPGRDTTGSGGSGGADDSNACKKEPILLSGTFRTADRPGVDQQFEDDGYGNLRTFYNTGTKKVYTNQAAGTVNYATGEICFGPVTIIGTGTNTTPDSNLSITDSVTGLGSVIDENLLPGNLLIPVVFIPDNVTTIPASTPGTIINVVDPEVTVSPIGTSLPSSIPLNSLTPAVFNQKPSLVEITPIDNNGSLNTSSCF